MHPLFQAFKSFFENYSLAAVFVPVLSMNMIFK